MLLTPIHSYAEVKACAPYSHQGDNYSNLFQFGHILLLATITKGRERCPTTHVVTVVIFCDCFLLFLSSDGKEKALMHMQR